MIVTGDIETILYGDLRPYGFKQYRKEAIKNGKVTDERIVVLCGTLQDAPIWKLAIVNVNICVPDVKGEANTKRLTEIERMFYKMHSVSEYDGSTYQYTVKETSQEEDAALKCHFVNLKIYFEVLNIKE